MKAFILLFFLGVSATGFAQNNTRTTSATPTYGYINGVRLDSIQAEYARFETRGDYLVFEYGQSGTRKDNTVKDSQGLPLLMGSTDKMFLLNFLYFNGWQLDKVSFSDKEEYDILRKRRAGGAE